MEFKKEISLLKKDHNQESMKIKELLEENTKKTKEVESKIKIQKNKTIKMRPETIKCEECGELCLTKSELKTHVKTHHPKTFCCDTCDKIFYESWQLEKHLETHSTKIKEKKCDICGKEFFLQWRFRQHINVHQDPNVPTCHYYNNNKVCPYDHVGCKFRHVDAPMCKKKSCENKLCPFRHPFNIVQ